MEYFTFIFYSTNNKLYRSIDTKMSNTSCKCPFRIQWIFQEGSRVPEISLNVQTSTCLYTTVHGTFFHPLIRVQNLLHTAHQNCCSQCTHIFYGNQRHTVVFLFSLNPFKPVQGPWFPRYCSLWNKTWTGSVKFATEPKSNQKMKIWFDTLLQHFLQGNGRRFSAWAQPCVSRGEIDVLF